MAAAKRTARLPTALFALLRVEDKGLSALLSEAGREEA